MEFRKPDLQKLYKIIILDWRRARIGCLCLCVLVVCFCLYRYTPKQCKKSPPNLNIPEYHSMVLNPYRQYLTESKQIKKSSPKIILDHWIATYQPKKAHVFASSKVREEDWQQSSLQDHAAARHGKKFSCCSPNGLKSQKNGHFQFFRQGENWKCSFFTLL